MSQRPRIVIKKLVINTDSRRRDLGTTTALLALVGTLFWAVARTIW